RYAGVTFESSFLLRSREVRRAVVARCEGVARMEERSSRSEASSRRTAERIAKEIASLCPD
ncbi:hypothetical protein, partial [Rhizobium indigoferae]|uniref:hypothetical protein n=1 Tax=Rhizobium indigoferae TaxID=158891 RepID=UPI0024E0F39E